MKKRTLCLLLAGAMALSLLSGCGSKDTGGKDEGTQNSAPASTDAGESVPTENEQNSEPVSENEGPFPRDPRWDELQPGELAVQYYDIFIKSGMTVGETVEAIENSAVYQEQSLSWGISRRGLDTEYTVKPFKRVTVDTADGTKTATEQGIYTYPENIVVQRDGKIIILIHFFADLPGEEGTIYRLRDLPVYEVTVRSDANFDSALTFMGTVGDIRNMGQQDVEALLDTVFKDKGVDTKLETEQKTVDETTVLTYRFDSRYPFSWNGYSIWTCPDQEEPFEGLSAITAFSFDADQNKLRDNWYIGDVISPFYWVKNDAG